MEKLEVQPLTGDPVAIPNPAGLHARPAAALAAKAKKYQSDIRLRINTHTQTVNAKSAVAIMGLGSQHGDQIQVLAQGSDATQAITELSAFLKCGCGEADDQASMHTPLPASPARPADLQKGGAVGLQGIAASPGLAVGHIVQFRPAALVISEAGGTPRLERLQFDAAMQESRAQIEALIQARDNKIQSKILEAHLELLEDPDLRDATLQLIDQRKSAAYAWQTAFVQTAIGLECLSGPQNALLRERGSDIRDIGRRVLVNLCGDAPTHFALPDDAILIAEELTPSDTAALDRSKLRGFCTRTGGATSHVAILARSFGIPAICGIDANALTLENGTLVILDGSQGALLDKPSSADVAEAKSTMLRLTALHERDLRNAAAVALTLDGHHIEVVANVRNAQDAQEAVANGAEGVGLLRSEFLFDDRATAPSEEEQTSAYTAVADAIGPQRPLVVRTLDVGGDKPLPYLPLPKEDNPFLGMRGIRVSLDHPDLLRTQLRAILRAAGHAKLHIMFPMVATLEELREAKTILAQELQLLGTSIEVQVGLMIEVPSAALMAEQFAREADFFSIGTNDLTQYTLAMDRGHPQLAKKADGLHPSVLKMVALTCEGAHAHGKWVGVCGGLASDTLAVPVLIGLGVTELSASVPAIPAIKSLIKRLALPECRALAQEVLRMGTATEVRTRLTSFAKSKEE
jgi:phosphoenolpyruvate-protein phosphotransferase